VATGTGYWSGISINITYSECVFVALGGDQRAMRMRYIVCVLSGFTVFFRVIS